MVRVIAYLVLVALVALGAAWLADRPGDVAVTWQGWRIETSVMVAAAAAALAIMLAVLLWSFIRSVLRFPDALSRLFRERRATRGYGAISKGLVAVGSGDLRAARRHAGDADRLVPEEPLALLLSAQTAQLLGDRTTAEEAFRAMAARADTKILGLRGLFVEAQRNDDMAAAQAYAEEAAKTAPALTWAGRAVLEFRCAAGDWTGALEALERNVKHGLVDKPLYRRQRAVLTTARAIDAAPGDGTRAIALALEAVKLAPDLVPAAALAGRLLADAGDTRKAARVLEAAWKVNPHPDLAAAYAHLRLGDSARERLGRIEVLAAQTPGNVESALALARAAADAREFARAREALAPFLAQPTQRVAELMAEIEELDHADEGRAREWMTRALHAPRDPAWTADGFVSERWMPVSPVSGRLDGFQWKVPVAELGGKPSSNLPRVIDARPASSGGNLPARRPNPGSEPAHGAAPAIPPSTGKAVTARAPIQQVEPVIPLVPVPDDPGPENGAQPPGSPEPPRRLSLFK
jgi:HemY protein